MSSRRGFKRNIQLVIVRLNFLNFINYRIIKFRELIYAYCLLLFKKTKSHHIFHMYKLIKLLLTSHDNPLIGMQVPLFLGHWVDPKLDKIN